MAKTKKVRRLKEDAEPVKISILTAFDVVPPPAQHGDLLQHFVSYPGSDNFAWRMLRELRRRFPVAFAELVCLAECIDGESKVVVWVALREMTLSDQQDRKQRFLNEWWETHQGQGRDLRVGFSLGYMK